MHKISYLSFFFLLSLGCLNTQPSEKPLQNAVSYPSSDAAPVASSSSSLLPWIALGTLGVVGTIAAGTYIRHPELFSLDWLLGNPQKDFLLQDFKPYQEEGLSFDYNSNKTEHRKVGPLIVPLVHLFQQLPTLSQGNCAVAARIAKLNLQHAPRIHRYNSEFKSDLEELRATIQKDFATCANEISILLDAKQAQEIEQNRQTACVAPPLNAFVLEIQKKLLKQGIQIQDQTAFYCDPKHPLFGEGKEDILWIEQAGKLFPVKFSSTLLWREEDKQVPGTDLYLADDRTGQECFHGSVDDAQAYLGFIETGSRRCGLPLEEKGKGGKLIALFNRIAKALGAPKTILEDISWFERKTNGGYYEISMRFYSLIKHGKTLYEQYGFQTRHKKTPWKDLPKDMWLQPGDVELVQQAKIQPILKELLRQHDNAPIRSLLNAVQDEHQSVKHFLVGMIEHPNESIGHNCSAFNPLMFYLDEYPPEKANRLQKAAKDFLEAAKRLTNHGLFMGMDL